MSNDDEIVELKRSELASLVELANKVPALVNAVEALTNAKANQTEEGGVLKARPSSNRSVTILFVDGKAVVGMENVGPEDAPVKLFEVVDPHDNKKTVLSANLQVKDLQTGEVTTLKNVSFLEFIQQAERQDCPIIKMVGEEWVIDHGVTMKRELEGDKYQMKDLGIEVPLEVSGTDYEYIVDVKGTPLTIHQDYVNMAKAAPRAEKTVIRTVNS